ncbi:alanine racemase [Amnibacterium kyonggiense]|uniref:Alanine racemase n=1 Tax=Amnibacterium kyonggiense TaxID=595671 RepID=A0A4R7FQU6_9MICO|nr:alanine racemase [Amnibacterium kyonggiense]TDS80167.1 alanine racemase [Amnibacterium kyonggiense]
MGRLRVLPGAGEPALDPRSGTAPVRRARIDTGAIEHNVRVLREIAGTPEFLAVVKADGYGHGAATAARAALAGGATWLGTADPDEALALRRAGVVAPILAWILHTDADFGEIAAAGIDLGVSSEVQVERVAATAPGAAVQIKLDTGLSRNGVEAPAWGRVFETAAALEHEGAIRVRGLFSHLANTSAAEDALAEERFADAVRLARGAGLDPALLHLSSTAAAVSRPQAAYTMVRCGIGIYGVSPFGDAARVPAGLRPAMTLATEVAAVRRIAPGTGVSYDHVWRADVATTLALVPLGYADGVPRAASGRAEVLLGGVRRPVRGRIAMDQFLVDVGDDEVRVGDEVVLFGDPATGAPSADEWGAWADTIGYEIVTRIGPRVEREPT